MNARAQGWLVASLLLMQGGILAASAMRQSPTQMEPAFLASGISHWQFSRFEPYRVNPPLVRMFAALPSLAIGCETDWSRFHDGAGTRAEFPLGRDYIKANGPASFRLIVFSRFACIPFSLIGAYVAYRWAKEIYGATGGFVTLVLYVFEPNLLGHGQLITPDGACTAFGLLATYAFWRWLKQPSWWSAAAAGGALGLAELAKMSWLILVPLWPFLWLLWRLMAQRSPDSASVIMAQQMRNSSGSHGPNDDSYVVSGLARHAQRPPASQLLAIEITALLLVNAGYAFDGFGTPLKDFEFVSTTLTGHRQSGTPGNRFANTPIGAFNIPLPKEYVRGFDTQKKDLEDFGRQSYLRGEWRRGGWWHYYIYGMLVKLPCGTWVLLICAALNRLRSWLCGVFSRDEVLLVLTPLLLMVVVSSQTEFNIHLRYVLPVIGFALVFTGSLGQSLQTCQRSLACGLVACVAWSVLSACCAYPCFIS